MTWRYRVRFDPGTGILTEWDKTLEELLMPNGMESLLDWMIRTADERGLFFSLESYKAEA